MALSTTTFLDAEVEVDLETVTIRANKILRWYRSDFAGLGGLENLLRQYRTEGLDDRRWKIEWNEYDWSI